MTHVLVILLLLFAALTFIWGCAILAEYVMAAFHDMQEGDDL